MRFFSLGLFFSWINTSYFNIFVSNSLICKKIVLVISYFWSFLTKMCYYCRTDFSRIIRRNLPLLSQTDQSKIRKYFQMFIRGLWDIESWKKPRQKKSYICCPLSAVGLDCSGLSHFYNVQYNKVRFMIHQTKVWRTAGNIKHSTPPSPTFITGSHVYI
jgi:hypothetical protein